MCQMLFETNRCIIRTMCPEDEQSLYEVLSDPEVMRWIEPPFSQEQTRNFIKNAGMCDKPRVYSIYHKAAEKVIGHLIFHPYEEEKCSYELGWILNRQFWYQGIAGELTETVIRYARQEQIPELVIECDPEQETTVHIAEKYGFIYGGICDGCKVYRLRV